MLRRLIALLALITGLAAYAVPAQAWGDGGASRAVATANAGSRASQSDCEESSRSEQDSGTNARERKAAPPKKTIVVRVPSVILASDRSLE